MDIYVKQAFSLASSSPLHLNYLPLYQVTVLLPGSPGCLDYRETGISPLYISLLALWHFVAVVVKWRVYFAPFSSSFSLLRVLHNCSLFLCIYIMCALSSSGTVIWAMGKKKIKHMNVSAFSHSYWWGAQCASTASHPAAVWAGKHKEHEPK